MIYWKVMNAYFEKDSDTGFPSEQQSTQWRITKHWNADVGAYNTTKLKTYKIKINSKFKEKNTHPKQEQRYLKGSFALASLTPLVWLLLLLLQPQLPTSCAVSVTICPFCCTNEKKSFGCSGFLKHINNAESIIHI